MNKFINHNYCVLLKIECTVKLQTISKQDFAENAREKQTF